MKKLKILFFLLFFVTSLFSKIIIGKNEFVILKDFSSKKLPSKIDTGAKTSSLHVLKIEIINNEYLKIKISKNEDWKKFKISRISNVKSSNGIIEKRYFIFTKIEVGQKIYDVEFSLSNRENMKYPILLGRNFLEKDFLVDVTKEYIIK